MRVPSADFGWIKEERLNGQISCWMDRKQMNQKVPNQAYIGLASYCWGRSAQACRIYWEVWTETEHNSMGQNWANQWLSCSYNNLSVHTHKLIMQWPLKLASLSSESTFSWLEHTVHATIWTWCWGGLPISPYTNVESRSVFQVSLICVFPARCPVKSWALPVILVTGSLMLGCWSEFSLSGIIRLFCRSVEENTTYWLLCSVTSEI